MTTLEKVAREMCTDLGINPDDWDETPDGKRTYRWELEVSTALAALQALIPPSDEVVRAAGVREVDRFDFADGFTNYIQALMRQHMEERGQ